MQISVTELQDSYYEFYKALNPRGFTPNGPLTEIQKKAIHHFTDTLHQAGNSPDLFTIKKHWTRVLLELLLPKTFDTPMVKASTEHLQPFTLKCLNGLIKIRTCLTSLAKTPMASRAEACPEKALLVARNHAIGRILDYRANPSILNSQSAPLAYKFISQMIERIGRGVYGGHLKEKATTEQKIKSLSDRFQPPFTLKKLERLLIVDLCLHEENLCQLSEWINETLRNLPEWTAPCSEASLNALKQEVQKRKKSLSETLSLSDSELNVALLTHYKAQEYEYTQFNNIKAIFDKAHHEFREGFLKSAALHSRS